jgi:hypothetical protein
LTRETTVEPGLPDELLLLALHDEHGTIIRAAAPTLRGALVGAAMMELSLRGRLSEDTDGRIVADPTPTGDTILDDVCLRIAGADRGESAAAWVRRLEQELPDLHDRLLERMVAAGVLERRERRILWVFPSSRHPLEDDPPGGRPPRTAGPRSDSGGRAGWRKPGRPHAGVDLAGPGVQPA